MLKANASYGLPRPGVTQLYPSFPDSFAPGWAYLLDTTTLTNGDHTLGVEVQDELGTRTFIGERHFKVFNPFPERERVHATSNSGRGHGTAADPFLLGLL